MFHKQPTPKCSLPSPQACRGPSPVPPPSHSTGKTILTMSLCNLRVFSFFQKTCRRQRWGIPVQTSNHSGSGWEGKGNSFIGNCELIHGYQDDIEMISNIKIISKGYQGYIERISKWYWKDIKIILKGYQNDIERISRWNCNGIKMILKEYRDYIKMISRWYCNDIKKILKGYQDHNKRISKWYWKDIKIILKEYIIKK